MGVAAGSGGIGCQRAAVVSVDGETKAEIDHLRGYLLTIIESNDRRYEERDKAAQAALHAALVSNDQRLKSMNEFRAALGDQSARMISRVEHDAATTAMGAKIDQLAETSETRLRSAIEPIAESVHAVGKPNWAAMASLASAFFVVIAGGWLVIGLKIDDSLAPITVGVEQARTTLSLDTQRLTSLEARAAASGEADTVSKTDRAQLNGRMHDVEQTISVTVAERRQQFAVMEARLVEVETQFCASDIVRNLMHATDMRLISLLWRKAFPDTLLPTDNSYYPMVCNRGGVAGLNR
jgi:hypothetical protein